MRPNPRDAAPPHLAITSTWSIRSKIIAVLLVPLVTLVVMWILATWVTVPPGLALLDARASVDAVGRPVQALITQLQSERKLAVTYLADPDADATELIAAHAATDAAVAEVRTRTSTDEARSALTDIGSTRLSELLLHLDALNALRAEVDDRDLDRPAALRRYTQAIEAGLSLSRSLIRLSDENLLREAQALMAMSEARELLAREDAVVGGALAAGELSQTDLSQAVTLVGAQRHQFSLAKVDLHVTDRLAYEEIAASEPAGTLLALEDTLIVEGRVGAALPVDAATWRDAYDALTADLRALELESADRLVERSRPQALFIFSRIAATGLLGLIAIVVTALGSVRVARSLLRRLAGLRQAAQEISIDRLPRVVERLRQGDPVDVAREAPPLPYGSDEIGQVGHAFNALQHTAVAAAVAEADLRRGVNEVFLNIARRSQTLLHRQLSILDGMERRAEDPTELEQLFRVDHLATRMRRNAEYLVILAGASPGRGWRLPVPLVDVLRGAVSEVEDYARVNVRPVPDLAVTGRAVGDLIHLLAELIENATVFSPPNTKVAVGAEPVTNGLAIEIEDRGIGILPPILTELNARLADPPDFAKLAERRTGLGDLSAGAQLGLFVVARLAARHGIRVELRRSAYGGTTAVALLPDALLTAPGEQTALPAGAGDLVPLDLASPEAPRSSVNSTAAGFTPVTAPGDPLPSRRGVYASDLDSADQLGEAETAVIIATAGRPLDERASRPPEPSEELASHSSELSEEPASRSTEQSDEPASRSTEQSDEPASRSTRRSGRHARREVIDPVDEPDGLPKRVRQRSARQPDDEAPVEVGNPTQPDGARSPEQVRAMMSSIQAGTDRGRRDAREVPDGADRTATGSPGTAGPDGGLPGPSPGDGVASSEQSGTGGDIAGGGGRTRRRQADGGVNGETTLEAT